MVPYDLTVGSGTVHRDLYPRIEHRILNGPSLTLASTSSANLLAEGLDPRATPGAVTWDTNRSSASSGKRLFVHRGWNGGVTGPTSALHFAKAQARRYSLRSRWSRLLIAGESDRPSRLKQAGLPRPATRIGGKDWETGAPDWGPPSCSAAAVAFQPARLPLPGAAPPRAAVARLGAPETPSRTEPAHP